MKLAHPVRCAGPAGGNLRSYLIQSYARDMGNGKTIMMREIDVPIRVQGRHWGGFRTAYRAVAARAPHRHLYFATTGANRRNAR